MRMSSWRLAAAEYLASHVHEADWTTETPIVFAAPSTSPRFDGS
jgi:hypothetical protein